LQQKVCTLLPTNQRHRTDLFPIVKYWIKIDDAMDVFAEHAVGGMIGLMANAIFGADYIVGLDGVTTGSSNPTTGTGIGGWVIHNYRQFYIQLAYVVAATGYSFVMSAILAFIVNAIPGLHLRASPEAELMGMDDDQLGEFAYDYVEVRRDYLAWTRSSDDQRDKDEDIPMNERYGIGEHADMADPNKSTDSSSSGGQKGLAQGDRHAIKAEDEKKTGSDSKKGI
jgi:Amt family ammonium transporter